MFSRTTWFLGAPSFISWIFSELSRGLLLWKDLSKGARNKGWTVFLYSFEILQAAKKNHYKMYFFYEKFMKIYDFTMMKFMFFFQVFEIYEKICFFFFFFFLWKSLCFFYTLFYDFFSTSFWFWIFFLFFCAVFEWFLVFFSLVLLFFLSAFCEFFVVSFFLRRVLLLPFFLNLILN